MVSIKFRGIRLCEPYAYLSGKLSPEILKNMVHRAGLRAQILESCIIKVSEEVSDKQPDLERNAFFDADSELSMLSLKCSTQVK